MGWQEEMFSWLKRRGPLGYAAIAIIIFIVVVWFSVYGYATFLISMDTIEGHLNPTSIRPSDEVINTTHFVDNEILNGSGQIRIISHSPNPPESLQLDDNGAHLRGTGLNKDYVLAGTSVTILFNVSKEDQIEASYRY